MSAAVLESCLLIIWVLFVYLLFAFPTSYTQIW